ncbi:hypothetical protein KY289_036883 [Solanum tuberosum]|nr:hypothetical protein KY289_036883 [Solanum tuberosum]
MVSLHSNHNSWYGFPFFTDAYDLFCTSLVTKLLGRIYYHVDGSSKPGSLPPNVSAAINGVAFCGIIAGQLFFEWIGDKIGRKKVYGITLMIMSICSTASGLSFGRDPKTVMATLCFFRFWLGFGIGGDYPLSATIMSEYANKNTRGAFIAAVFAMQGFAYQVDPLGSTVPQADYVWRIILMAGSLPALLTYYWRMKMPETARYTTLVAKNVKQATADMEKVMQVDIGTDQKEPAPAHGFFLILHTTTKTCSKRISSVPLDGFLLPRLLNAIEEVQKIAGAQTLMALCSTMPGYWFTVFLIDRIGRFTIQLIGFTMMTVFMFALAIPYHHWTLPGHLIGFVVLYSFTFFFANFGPNATTFVVPAEILPARLRSTCHGIPAAWYPAGIGGKSLKEMSRENEDSTEEGAEVENQSSDNRTVPV